MRPSLLQRERPKRPPWAGIALLLALVTLWEIFRWQTERRHMGAPVRGEVIRLSSPRKSPDAYGRSGDLVLVGASGESLTIAAAPNIAGHRPLVGAIVDIGTGSSDVSDPLIWLRTTTVDDHGALAELEMRSPQPFTCADGGAGVRAYGALGVGLTSEACSGLEGRFSLTTTMSSLPETQAIVDEINVGSLGVVAEKGALIEGEVDTAFLAFGGKGTAALIEAPRMHASRTVSRFGAEVFPAPVVVRYGADKTATRALRLVRGDVLDALALLPSARSAMEVTFGPDRGGEVAIQSDSDLEIARGHVAAGATRTIRLPPGLGDHALLRDDDGVVTDARVPLPAPGKKVSVRAASVPAGAVTLGYHDEAGAPLPVHVLIKGLAGTADPRPSAATDRAVVAGRSLYLIDGRTRVALPAGRYRLTASHGMAYSLAVSEVAVTAGAPREVEGTLRRVLDTSGWVSADFHLHSAPSPDSDVALEERVASLACEGVELAVATDHNRVTDLGPPAQRLGQDGRLATAPGVEITSVGQRWGHFNAYPLPVPSGAPEEGVPVYFGKLPADMFHSARELGARVIQVNHARMEPSIGYFDLAHLDPKTGRAGGEFASDFDVFEAYNGMWIERRDKVREGPRDVVALARRGKRVAVVGDSDSHKLLYEEAGYPRTYVHTPEEPASTRFDRAVAMLLGAADTTVTSGPFVEMWVEGQSVGSTVKPGKAGSVHVRVRVSAPAWVPVERVEVWRDDTVAQSFAVEGPPKDGVRFLGELDLPIEGKDAVVLAWAEADQPLPDVVPYEHALSIGFTGAAYVDGDGDGSVVVPEGRE